MINPTSRPKSCQVFLVHNKLVVRRDDFLNTGLRVGNTEEAEILSLSSDRNSQDDFKVGKAILRAFDQVKVITSLPERRPDYVPPYILATNFVNFEEFETFCSSCGCVQSQDYVLLFPTIYEPIHKGFRHDRSNQVTSALDPVVLGHIALTVLGNRSEIS
jgi:hypothetical protein